MYKSLENFCFVNVLSLLNFLNIYFKKGVKTFFFKFNMSGEVLGFSSYAYNTTF